MFYQHKVILSHYFLIHRDSYYDYFSKNLREIFNKFNTPRRKLCITYWFFK